MCALGFAPVLRRRIMMQQRDVDLADDAITIR
jgi:hypothetical protein